MTNRNRNPVTNQVKINVGKPAVRPLGKRPQSSRPKGSGRRSAALTVPKVPRLTPSALVHINPFSRHAEGARILDGFRAMTVAYPIPTSDVLSTNASGSAQMLILPNLACSALVLSGSVSTTNGIFRFASSTAPTGNDPTSGQLPVNLSGISVDLGTNLRTVGTSYRLVGWGVVFKTLPGVSATGRVILSKFTPRGKAPLINADAEPFLLDTGIDFVGNGPAPTESRNNLGVLLSSDPSPLASRPTIANFLRQNGLPPAGASDTAVTMEVEALRRIPGTVTASVASLGVNGLLVRGKRTSNQFLEWRGTGPWPAGAGSIIAGRTVDTTTASASQSVQTINTYMNGRAMDSTYLDMTGHDGLALAVTGAAASASVLDYEIIYHVEVTPRTEALLTSLRPPVVDVEATPTAAAAAARAHATTPHFQLVPHHFREMSNGVLAGLGGKFSQLAVKAATATVGGVVGRAMSMGLEGAMGALTL